MGCIAGEESIEKRQKIDNLCLSVDEWKRIQIFKMLLDVSTHIIYFVLLEFTSSLHSFFFLVELWLLPGLGITCKRLPFNYGIFRV